MIGDGNFKTKASCHLLASLLGCRSDIALVEEAVCRWIWPIWDSQTGAYATKLADSENDSIGVWVVQSMLHRLDLGNVRDSTKLGKWLHRAFERCILNYESTGEGTGLGLSSLGEASGHHLKNFY